MLRTKLPQLLRVSEAVKDNRVVLSSIHELKTRGVGGGEFLEIACRETGRGLKIFHEESGVFRVEARGGVRSYSIQAKHLNFDEARDLTTLYLSQDQGWMYSPKWECIKNDREQDQGDAKFIAKEAKLSRFLPVFAVSILPISGLFGLLSGGVIGQLQYLHGLLGTTLVALIIVGFPLFKEWLALKFSAHTSDSEAFIRLS